MAEEDSAVLDAPGDDAPPPSSRDDIAAAFDAVEQRDATPAAGTPAPGEAPAPNERGGGVDRVRGPDGRFAPGTGLEPAHKAAGAPDKPLDALASKQAPAIGQRAPDKPAAPADPAGAQQPQLRAPASWKPNERELWAKLPPDVQQAVVRRETETARSLQESARARDALTHVQRVVSPYTANIQASGSDAIGAIENFFKADHTLRHGSVSEKAQLAANIIKQYGVDINALDQVLAGQAVTPDPNTQMAEQLRREMQQQLQPVMQYFNGIQGQRQRAMQQINSDAGGQVETFAQDPKNEFFEDVREDMADIIDLYTARGASISLQDAYNRAINMNPQVSAIVQQRAEQQRVNTQAQAAQRARRAAASISGSPAPAGAAPGPAGDDRRATIAAAWDDASNG